MKTTREMQTGQWWLGLRVMIALGLCQVVSGMATAAMIDWNYDGSYAPDSATPPAGQSTWTVVTTGGLAIQPNTPNPGEAFFDDNSGGGRIQMSNSFGAGDVSGVEWEYSVRMAVNTPGFPRTFFGVRDEGAVSGKFVMFAHSSTGANLFYVINAGGGVMGPDIYTGDVDGPSLGDGLMHDYRMVKYDDAGTMMLDFYLDSTLLDTRPYVDFSDAASSDLGIGVFTATPGTSDYVIDELTFTAVPEPGSSVLLVVGLLMAVLPRRRIAQAIRTG